MDDEDYARELFAILTRPLDPDEPRDAYGTGADGIDRAGGFGTEVTVTSVAAVPGPYGSQLEVGFRLEVPEGRDVPSEGTVHLPLALGWREASGLTEPEDYAPRVAARVSWAAREHVVQHSGEGRTDHEVPGREVQHQWLMQVLEREGRVEVPLPGRYVVHTDDERGDLLVLLTPAEWEQVLRRHGPPRGGFDVYEETFGASDESIWVCWEGDLAGSIREELPPVLTPRPSRREIRRRTAEAEASGQTYGWFAYAPGTEAGPRA